MRAYICTRNASRGLARRYTRTRAIRSFDCVIHNFRYALTTHFAGICLRKVLSSRRNRDDGSEPDAEISTGILLSQSMSIGTRHVAHETAKYTVGAICDSTGGHIGRAKLRPCFSGFENRSREIEKSRAYAEALMLLARGNPSSSDLAESVVDARHIFLIRSVEFAERLPAIVLRDAAYLVCGLNCARLGRSYLIISCAGNL